MAIEGSVLCFLSQFRTHDRGFEPVVLTHSAKATGGDRGTLKEVFNEHNCKWVGVGVV